MYEQWINKLKIGNLRSSDSTLILIHKNTKWAKSRIKNFIQCFSYLCGNIPETFSEVTFYENEIIFGVEYSLPKEEYIGINTRSDLHSQMEFLLKAFLSFANNSKNVIKALDKIFPGLMCLFFSPDNFYYHYDTRHLVCNFVQILPKLFIGGRTYYNGLILLLLSLADSCC